MAQPVAIRDRSGGVGIVILLSVLGAATLVYAAVVGNGDPSSCTEAALDSALAAGGTITFDCGTAPVTITVTSEKTIRQDTTIDGGGLVTLSGGGATRIIWVEKCTVTLTNLILRDAVNKVHSVDGGGALYNHRGTLTVSNSLLANNQCNFEGGAIHNNFGRLILTDDVLADNHAISAGGAFQASAGHTKVTRCTFDNNTALGGGAIRNEGGTITVADSTFSNNSAPEGGAIRNQGMLKVANSTFSNNSASIGGALACLWRRCTISNSTFVSNSADEGSAIYHSDYEAWLTVLDSTFLSNVTGDGVGGSISTGTGSSCSGPRCKRPHRPVLMNTILAGTPAQANCGGGTPIVDRGHNLDSGNSCGFKISRRSLINTDPGLDPAGLADNGGPTQTIAAQAGSPAIGAGGRRGCVRVRFRDQRGFRRPGTGSTRCTIGAYEFNSPGPP
jgi:predicted outer membrane repeat protein